MKNKQSLSARLAVAAAAAAPPPKIVPEKAEPTATPTAVVPSREGKRSYTVWLPPAFRSSILMVMAQTGETQEQIFARGLNEVFKAAGVPVVSGK